MTDILVTGGAGFIGSHLVERLAERGDRIAIYDNFDAYYDRATKEANIREALTMNKVRLVEADILDKRKLFATFAARPGVRPSFEMPGLYLDINTTGTLNVLQACREYGVAGMIYASSSSVYGA